jgi:DNA repair exonuclease SbcCD ATPase subunit
MGIKDDYEKQLKARLREWQAQIEVFRARADQAEAEQKIAYREEIDSLQQRKQGLQQKLEELQESGGAAWDDIKTGVDRAWQELDDALARGRERFR